MHNQEKVDIIKGLCNEIISDSIQYSDQDMKSYFDYDTVITLLTKSKEVIKQSARCPRPEHLPEDLIWSEKYYNENDEVNPYVYDGSMSAEEFEKLQEKLFEDEELER